MLVFLLGAFVGAATVIVWANVSANAAHRRCQRCQRWLRADERIRCVGCQRDMDHLSNFLDQAPVPRVTQRLH